MIGRALVLSVVLASLAGCAYESRQAPPPAEPIVIAVERETPAVDVGPPEPAGRPRLSKTVTLGEVTRFEPARPAPPPRGSGGVVVNNNIVVNGGAPAYGYYGGYYGGYGGYYGGYHRGSDPRGASHGHASPSGPGWGATGFEGAQRTAAPGQTPNIGGNWAPPPSYGPKPMR